MQALNALALRLVHAVFLSVTIAIESARWLLRRRFDQLPTRAPAHVGIVVGSSSRDPRLEATLEVPPPGAGRR